jgi:DNA polymerase (family X)
MQDRFYIAGTLRQIAQLLQIVGENPYKTRAYERGARALENLEADFDALVKSRRLTEIDGVGNALAAVIDEIYYSGESAILRQLRDELPPGAVELSAVPGLSLKKIAALHDALRIENLADLKTACEKGLVRNVKGFGEKAEAKILTAIEQLDNRQDRTLLNHALAEAERLLRHLRACSAVRDAAIAGSLRRRKETVHRILLVAGTDEAETVIDRFLRFPAFAEAREEDDGRCTGRFPRGLEAELHTCTPSEYVASLHWLTGSREHCEALQAHGREKGLLLGPTGMRSSTGAPVRVKNEREIYRRLGLQFVPPELRENSGEIGAAAAGTLPETLEVEEIQGMVHCHTTYSDGLNSVLEMALAAEALGLKYITITDHSPNAFYARGVNIDRLRAQWDEIAQAQEQVSIRLLKGTESDILEDGSLDYPDYILEKFDVIIASIHARNKMSSDQMTTRLVRAMQLPVFKIWGHPLGRLIQSRPPFECRIDEVLDVIAASRAAVEVNGDPRRLDLAPQWVRAARERGIKFVVSSDAHSTKNLQNFTYGVDMARRGWLTRQDVLNTLDAEQFLKAVHP